MSRCGLSGGRRAHRVDHAHTGLIASSSLQGCPSVAFASSARGAVFQPAAVERPAAIDRLHYDVASPLNSL
jgi:hypothetical protein